MKDYLASKSNSNILCQVLRRKYAEMGLDDVKVWSEHFELGDGKVTLWSVRSDLTTKHPELFQF
tara:strand:+ start:101 stop:292 length:192 start_codon:yes stop_codon:yes gene_type:complete